MTPNKKTIEAVEPKADHPNKDHLFLSNHMHLQRSIDNKQYIPYLLKTKNTHSLTNSTNRS